MKTEELTEKAQAYTDYDLSNESWSEGGGYYPDIPPKAYIAGYKQAVADIKASAEAKERECDGGRSGGRDDMLDNSYNGGLYNAISDFVDLLD